MDLKKIMNMNIVAAALAAMVILAPLCCFAAEEPPYYREFPKKDGVAVNKYWTVVFTEAVDFYQVDESDLYVNDEYGNRVEGTSLYYEHSRPNILVIRPPESGWPVGVECTLFSSFEIMSAEGEQLSKPMKMAFKAGYENEGIIMSLERSNSIPRFYRAFVQTDNEAAKYYALYKDGERLTDVTPLEEKAIFLFESGSEGLTVKVYSSESELDVVGYENFPLK